MLAGTVSEEVLTLITLPVDVVGGLVVLLAVTTILSPALKFEALIRAIRSRCAPEFEIVYAVEYAGLP